MTFWYNLSDELDAAEREHHLVLANLDGYWCLVVGQKLAQLEYRLSRQDHLDPAAGKLTWQRG
jgi:hypothetical protein